MNPTPTAEPLAPDQPDLRSSLMERSPAPMAEVEGAGHILRYVNPAFCRLVGKSTEALLGTSFTDTVQAGESCLALLERVYRTGEAETHTAATHPEPHSAFWSYTMWPVLDAAHRPVGVMVQVTETTQFHQQMVATNEALLRSAVHQHELTAAAEQLNAHLQTEVTARKQAEVALRRAKEAAEAADHTKSEFLATMSHELRTPLNVILGYTAMLIEEVGGNLPHVEILRRIDHNARVLFELISMVLDLNRLEAGRLPVDVQEVAIPKFVAELQAELQGLCDQSGLACLWSVAPGLPVVHTDAGKLKVILKNLVSNAVKFTQEGSITLAATERHGGVEFRVTDTGIGIPAEAHASIFEPFRQLDGSDTRRYGGSGLGLHIVRRLLEVLGGHITVESTVGQGSTFRVWLPRLISVRLSSGVEE